MSDIKQFAEYIDNRWDAPVGPGYDVSKTVPNKPPRINASYRIAVVGEAPGADEIRQGEPFVGMSGRFLTSLLSKAGIVRDAIFIGNICQHRPPENDISKFAFDGDEIKSGLTQLQSDLNTFQPHVCLLLGKTALQAAKPGASLSDWRGSMFVSTEMGPFFGRKCLAAYHPAACLRQYEWTPLLMFDIIKCRREGNTPILELPQRNLITDTNLYNIIVRLKQIKQHKRKVATDIEGGIDSMSCLSFATSPTESFIVPFTIGGESMWQPDAEVQLWRLVADILEDPEIPKVLQNSLYDRFVLQYSYGVVVRGVVDDTMLKHWELYCELEKSLGFQCSIYTSEPFYKQDRKSEDLKTFWEYCCRDSAVTFEISEKLDRILDDQQKAHYRFNMDMLNPLLYMELRGINYDQTLAKERCKAIWAVVYELQCALDEISDYGCPREITKREDLLKLLQNHMCHKKHPDKCKKAFEQVYPELREELVNAPELTKAFFGRLSMECGLSLNIKSPRLKEYLYGRLALPIQYKKDPKTKMDHPSTDYEALLRLSKKSTAPAIKLCIEIGLLRTRAQMLSIYADPDGRIRCGYNIVGTETGRITCYTSPTGSGYNLQTIPPEDTLKPDSHPLRRGMRDLFCADSGYYIFQCDLSGADGWTVGAHLSRLGDPTMLDDLRAGLKPARIICYMLRHGHTSLHGHTRSEIGQLIQEVKKEDWDYFACKQGIWGTCYTMGPLKLQTVILIQSEGKINLSNGEVKEFQAAVHARYHIKMWHDSTARALSRKSELTSASGHRRRFFGRSQEVLGQALANEPQENTTYATNKAALRLWPLTPRIEPLHQVHDALVGQWKIEDTDWAISQIKQAFNNPLFIAGQQIVIPFEGQYGTDWALEEGRGLVGKFDPKIG
jgi:uracil-DNA glycosylase family 4